MNSTQMITYLQFLKDESNKSVGFSMQKYHDLYDTDKKQAKFHYSIAMDEITKIGVYVSLIEYIQNDDVLHDTENTQLPYSNEYITFMNYMDRIQNNDSLSYEENEEFESLLEKFEFITI